MAAAAASGRWAVATPEDAGGPRLVAEASPPRAKRAAEAQPAVAQGAIGQLEAFITSTRSATGTFRQSTVRGDAESGQSAQGDFAFSRPGRFRWHIQKPYEQLIVTDGAKMHLYDPDLRQVTVRPADEAVGASPAALLFGRQQLDEAFVLKEIPPPDEQSPGVAWIEARPRDPQGGFDRVLIGMQNGMPQLMRVTDAFGQVTTFTFMQIERNAKLPDSTFQFTPPAGVDVVQ